MPPSFHVGNKYADVLTVKAGQTLRLEIPYRAVPPPEVSWTFNENPLEGDKRTKVCDLKQNTQ